MRQFLTFSVLVLVPLFFLWGCDNDTSNGDIVDGPGTNGMTCIGCHSSREMLELALAGSPGGSKVSVPNKGDG